MQKGVHLETKTQHTRNSWAATLPGPPSVLSLSSTLSPCLSYCAFIPPREILAPF